MYFITFGTQIYLYKYISLLIKKKKKSTDSQVDLSGHGKFQEEMLFQEFYLQSMANFSSHVSIFHMLPKRQVPESSITNQKDTTFRSPFCKQFWPSISGKGNYTNKMTSVLKIRKIEG